MATKKNKQVASTTAAPRKARLLAALVRVWLAIEKLTCTTVPAITSTVLRIFKFKKTTK